MSTGNVALNRENLSYLEARERVLASVEPVAAEEIPLRGARGRALRQAPTAPHPLPPFTRSAIDGYAVRTTDLRTATGMSPVELRIVDFIPPGSSATRPLGEGEAMRVSAASGMPEDGDAVVSLENLQSGTNVEDRVWFSAAVAPGENVRLAGGDLEQGAEVLPVGRELSAHDVALLASLGIAQIQVGSRPRVALISIGDELIRAEESLRRGTLRDSNLPLLRELIEEGQCRLVDEAQVSDDPAVVARALARMVETADVVICVGGVSACEAEPVKQALTRLDPPGLWSVALSPGDSLALAAGRGRLFIGLPGYPAAVACMFEALVRPALRKMQGFSCLDRPKLPVQAAETIPSQAGRTDFVRASVEWRGDGWWARPTGPQTASFLTPQSRAQALLLLPEDTEALMQGDTAEAWVLRWPELASLAVEAAPGETRAPALPELGPQWNAMNSQERLTGVSLVPNSVPAVPGVYAWYRRGEPVYVGGAANLRTRIWRDHLSEEQSLARSELRRRAAEFLGLASAQDIHMGFYTPTEGDVEVVRRWIRSCEVAWIPTPSEDDAEDLEKALIGEWTPAFNKR